MTPAAPPAIVSQAFADRAARLRARIADDAHEALLARGQYRLLLGELDVAKHARASDNPDAAAMLDVIDRQLAAVDFTLSRAEDGTAIVVHADDTVTIAMNDSKTWTLQQANPSLLALHRGVMFRLGVQGAFTARAPGTAKVTLAAPGAKPVRFTVVILPKS